MRYWWVNQNATFKHETTGGYLWSPKRTKTSRNQFYDNMLEVKPGDIIFSFADTYIKAIGVATSGGYAAEKPKVFGSAGQNWPDDGWKVDVEFSLVQKPIRPKDHMHLIEPLLPEKYSPLQKNGNGIQTVYLAALSDEFGKTLLGLSGNPELTLPVVNLSELTYNIEEQELISEVNLKETVKASLIMSRRGQGVFRNRVMLIEQSCRVTGVRFEKLLTASHIKPWKVSDNQERLEGNNGLFLSPHVDKLFDSGFISFTAKGEMLVSPLLDNEVLPKWRIDPRKKYGKFNSEQAFFLEFHNAVTFQQKPSV